MLIWAPLHPWMRGFPPAPNHPQAPPAPQNSASAESCAVRVMVSLLANVTGDKVRLCACARVYVCMCVRGWVGRWGCVCVCVCVCACVCVCVVTLCHVCPNTPESARSTACSKFARLLRCGCVLLMLCTIPFASAALMAALDSCVSCIPMWGFGKQNARSDN